MSQPFAIGEANGSGLRHGTSRNVSNKYGDVMLRQPFGDMFTAASRAAKEPYTAAKQARSSYEQLALSKKKKTQDAVTNFDAPSLCRLHSQASLPYMHGMSDSKFCGRPHSRAPQQCN
jgi:hypothetical protein